MSAALLPALVSAQDRGAAPAPGSAPAPGTSSTPLLGTPPALGPGPAPSLTAPLGPTPLVIPGPGTPLPTSPSTPPPPPPQPSGPVSEPLVPVAPEVQPTPPPPTVGSAPQRVLPTPSALGVAPTATFQIDGSVGLSEEYTDNFDLSDRDRRSNFRSTVAPGLRLTINSAFTKGIIQYTLAPSHDSVTDDITFFQSLLGQVVWQANPRWTLTLSDTFTRSDEPGEADRLALRQERRTFSSNTISLFSDYLIGRVSTRQSYRLSTFFDENDRTTTTHAAGLSATVPIAATNALSLGYEYLTSDTSGGNGGTNVGGAGTADVSGHQITTSIARKLTTLRSVGLAGSYAFRTLSDETGDTDFRPWNVSLFTNYLLPGRLTLNGSLGVSGLSTGDGDTLGPNLSTATSLSYQFARATFTLAFDRGFSETFSEGENFGVVETEGITGSLSYPFTATLLGSISGYFRRSKFTGVGNSDTDQDDRNENYGGTVALAWRLLGDRLLLDLIYSYRNQKGTDTSYSENRVRAGLSVRF